MVIESIVKFNNVVAKVEQFIMSFADDAFNYKRSPLQCDSISQKIYT